MTATTAHAKPRTQPSNGNGRFGSPMIEVEQAALVERFNAIDTFATDAIDANGAAIWITLTHLPNGPEKSAIQEALHFAHEAIKRTVAAARVGAGNYDWKRPSR